MIVLRHEKTLHKFHGIKFIAQILDIKFTYDKSSCMFL